MPNYRLKPEDERTPNPANHGRVPPAKRVVGIDLGTTNCCLSACEDGSITILEIDGQRSMPSFAAFTDQTYLVGYAAKQQAHLNTRNTIYDAKRLIGRDFNDNEVQEDLINMHWNFLVNGNEAGRPCYAVRCLGEDMRVMPEMIGQLLLTKMKETAEAYFGAPLTGAVITVPAYFNDAQRQATKTAAAQANLHVLQIINEPTAAALAYSWQHSHSFGESSVLIFDLGGGTFDVSLVTIDGTLVNVKATGGDNHLGGEDFTNNLVRHMLGQIKQRYNADLQDMNVFKTRNGNNSPAALDAAARRALLRLKNACEDIKCALSYAQTTTKLIDDLWPAEPQFQANVDKLEFEELNERLFQLCLECTTKVLRDARVEPAAVDKVVLVGGSTRIPRIRQLLTSVFGEEKICDKVNPDEVVAYGAGVNAASRSGLAEAILMDVTNHSLGCATVGDVLAVVFPRNSPVGKTQKRKFTTTCDNQTTVRFDVYEGEETKASANKLLDSFFLKGIPAMPAGKADILVKFRVDFDGTLSATATDETIGGIGKSVRRALRVSRTREETAIREREEMSSQATKFAASRHRNAEPRNFAVAAVAV